jgi:hypothetical protein
VKIAFVGASGYGNIGDDTYPLVLREHLPEHELIFHNSDLPAELPSDLGAIVLGGGGLIYNTTDPPGGESHHFACMRFYMDWARKHGVPWGLLSCGVQIRIGQEDICMESLAPWTPWLQGARFITLRSAACVDVVRSLTGREDVKCFPDLAYLYRPPPAAAKKRTRAPVVFIPAGLVNPRNKFCNHLIRSFASARVPMTWLGMGAHVDDDPHLTEARRAFPEAAILWSPSPEIAFRTIAAARFVLTGRYHGMVFARINRIPFYVPQDAPWKIRNESFDADMRDASGHLRTLRDSLRA